MELKITIALDERAQNTLNRLIDAIGGVGGAERKNVEPTHAPEAAQTALKRTKPTNEETPDKTANVKPNPKSAAVAALEIKEPIIGIEELRGLAADVKTKTGKASAVKELLTEFKAAKLSEIPPDRYEQFAARLGELL